MTVFKGPDGQEDMPYLLLPGPVTTSRTVKFAMLADYGPQDADFTAILRAVKTDLLRLAVAEEEHECFLVAGSGQHAIEAAVGAFCPAKRKKTLVVSNGTDGDAIVTALERAARPCVKLAYKETSTIRADDITKALNDDRNISHVWLVHCESSTGMLNDIRDIATTVKSLGRILLVDASTTFGGMSINVNSLGIDVLTTRPDACLESVPGFGIVLARRSLFDGEVTESHSAAMNLRAPNPDTMPTHAVAALREAINAFHDEGGIAGRQKRYKTNSETVRNRLRALGYVLLLPDVDASPFTQTVLAPQTPRFSMNALHKGLRDRGFAVANGTLPTRSTFRIGCMGRVDEAVMLQFIIAMDEVMQKMDVRSLAPAAQ